MGQIRRVYAKADLTYHELRILYGTLASMIKHNPNSDSVKEE
jgi:tRNA (cytidine32/uridine32-2'-O)-methyltransferase